MSRDEYLDGIMKREPSPFESKSARRDRLRRERSEKLDRWHQECQQRLNERLQPLRDAGFTDQQIEALCLVWGEPR